MHTVDLLVIIFYLFTLIAIGIRVSSKQTTTDSYFVAGRSVPGWAAGMSLLATTITSVTFIAYPGAAYAGDWSLLVPGIYFVILIAMLGPVVVPFFRRTVSMSVYEYFGKRFGPGVRMYASFAFAAGHFAKMGFVFYLLALTVSSITGWSIAWMLIGLGAITIFYTWIGGLKAVIWTDVVQGTLLWTGVGITLVLLFFSKEATPSAMLHLIATHHKTSLGEMHFNLARPTFWTLAIYGIFFYLQRYTADQSIVQRYLAARTDREALRGIALGASLCLPVWTAFMLIGSLLWAFYSLTGKVLPHVIQRPDQVFPYYIVSELPAGVGGIFLAALLGAAMSMLSADLNCLGLVLVEDFYTQLFPASTDKQKLRFGKASILVCGAMAIVAAILLARVNGTALALYYAATAIVAGGLAGIFLLAFLSRRVGRTAVVAGIAANILFTIYASLTLNGGKILNLHSLNYPWHEYTIGAIGNLLLVAVGLLIAQLFPAPTGTSAQPTLWGWLATLRQSRIPVLSIRETQ
jgi:solute:Na+ symporter, SSS family